MPALYQEGARKAWKSRRNRAYSTDEPISTQGEKEWMLREQIRKSKLDWMSPEEKKGYLERKEKRQQNEKRRLPVWMHEDYNVFANRKLTLREANKKKG